MTKERKATPDRAQAHRGKELGAKEPGGKALGARALGRREFLRTLGAGATVAAAAAGPLAAEARADTESYDEKRKSRYQANSAEVQTFYRVNRYPG
jgi:hypothetical protein